MEMDVKKLIWEINQIFPYTDKRIEIEKSKKDNLDFWQYLVNLDDKFYDLINEIIISLQQIDLSVQQRAEISDYLINMCNYHFNEFPKHIEDPETFTSYRYSAVGSAHSNGKLGVYVKHADFTKERIDLIINEMKRSNLIILDSIEKSKNEEFPWSKYEKEAWFRVAVEYAQGKVEKLKKDNNWEVLADELFSDVPVDKKGVLGYKRSNLRILSSQSYTGGKKSIFKRKDEDLQKVIDYCKFHNLKIDDKRFKTLIEKDSLS